MGKCPLLGNRIETKNQETHQNTLARGGLMFFHYLLLYIDVFFFSPTKD